MSHPDLAGLRVLLVDDHQDGALALARILGSYGCEVETCFDAASALESAPGFRPQAVVLDIRLPDMLGTELCRELRSREATAGALFVAVTGVTDPASRAAVEAAGFDEMLSKPLALPAVLAVLRSAPGGRTRPPVQGNGNG